MRFDPVLVPEALEPKTQAVKEEVMTPRLAALTLALCLIALVALSAAATGPSVDLPVDVSQIEILQEDGFSKLALEGHRSLAEVGAPAIPARVIHFVIPADMAVEDIIISFTAEEELPGVHRVRPVQPEVPIGETPPRADPDASIYESDAIYPSDRAVFLGDGYLGGYHIASIALSPLRYHPLSGRLVLTTDLSAQIKLVASVDRSAPRHRITASSDERYRSIVRGLVENPEDVAAFAKQSVEVVDGTGAGAFAPRYGPSLEGSLVEYVIITDENLAPCFQDIADWKTKKGVPAVVKTVSWINANYTGGSDTAERIRLFIQDAFASWGTTYVLLGGDTNIVPIRFIRSSYYGGWDISTDLYYSDLDGNWNGDGDNYFGEGYGGVSSPGDSLDLYPDVFVGRATVTNIIEAETFVDKTISYVATPDPLFTERDLFLAEVLFPYDWQPGDYVSTDGAEHVVEPMLHLIPPAIHTSLVYQNYSPFPSSFPLNRVSMIDSLERGYNIISHVGHGNKDIMRAGFENYVTIQDVDALTNGISKSGLIWMLNCTSTAIEYDCIAEHVLNNPGGGTAFVYGPTRFCFPTTAKDYYYSWFEYLHAFDTTRAGVVSAMCKVPYVAESAYDNTDRWTQMSFVLLGDPEARLWTARPAGMTVVHNNTVPLGQVALAVSVSNPAAVDSALVCVVKDGEVYATGLTNASGQALLSFAPLTTGSMTITVTAANQLPYEDTIVVTSSAGAYVTVRSVTLDDDAVAPSDGNANGLPEAGESIEISMLIGNAGQTQATAVTATLTSTDPAIAIIDGTEYIGDIAATSEMPLSAPFAITIADTCPNEYETVLEVEFSEGTRLSWISEYTLRVFRPIPVQLRNHASDDGNGDGIPDIGEHLTLTIDILNEGDGDADLVTGTLRYPGAEVTITDSTDSWGDIAAGQEVASAGSFEFDIVSAVTQPFELELSDEDGKIWTLLFDLTPPAEPLNLAGRVKSTTIYLTWDPTDDVDLWGYNIYRAEHLAGPYSQANNGTVELISYFEDAGLDENTRYYYEVAAIDSSGNEGDHSDIIEISTNPPSQPGWPLPGGESIYGTPALVDIDLDGDLELLVGAGHIYCWHHNGVEYRDGDGDPRTEGVYEVDGQGGYRSSIAVGEMDGDPYPEIVCAAWANVGDPQPEYEIFAWNAEDATVLDGWPKTTTKFCWATPALGDLDHDGLDDVVIPCADGFVYAWSANGSELIDGDNNAATDGVFADLMASWAYGSAVIVDLDGDHELEILVPSRSESIYCFNPDGTRVPGWPVRISEKSIGSPCVADLDGDGDLEVLAAADDDSLWVFDHEGMVLPGWPKNVDMGGDFPPSPTVADITGNGQLEIIQAGVDGSIYIWTWYGSSLPGWPQMMDEGTHSSPAVGDIDGDSDWEIVIGCNSGKVYAFDDDGSILAGWPIQTDAEIYCTPTLVDFDDDGDVEVIVSGMDANVYVWDVEGDYDDGSGVQWATFRHNFLRNGFFGYEEPVGVHEGGVTTHGRMVLEQNFPNPFNPTTTIAFLVPDGGAAVELGVFNVAGEHVRTLLAEEMSAGRKTVVWNGLDDHGERASSGVYFVRLTSDATKLTKKVVLLK